MPLSLTLRITKNGSAEGINLTHRPTPDNQIKVVLAKASYSQISVFSPNQLMFYFKVVAVQVKRIQDSYCNFNKRRENSVQLS